MNWYKNATSLGMYMESISKRIAELAIGEIKRIKMDNLVKSFSINIQEAIANTNIPENIKNNILSYFLSFENFNFELYATKFDGELKDKKITSRGGNFRRKDGKQSITVMLNVNIRLVKDMNTILQDAYEIINPIVRHELEHMVQYVKMNPRDQSGVNKRQQDFSSYIPMSEDPAAYYVQPSEVESHVVQLYMRAKAKRMPFEMELKNFVNTEIHNNIYNFYFDNLQLQYFSPGAKAEQLTQQHLGHIYNTYLSYAKSRYPNLLQNKS